ncbi:MAG: ShlB/FhaC/HecB family hemolysin secretion/activation protein [Aquabacterium sp.]
MRPVTGLGISVMALALWLGGHTLAIAAPAPLPPDSVVQEQQREQQRQQQRDELLRKQLQPTPDVRLPSPVQRKASDHIPTSETPCFPIKGIELQDDDSGRFHWALEAADDASAHDADPVMGRCLGAQGINIVIGRVQNALIERGYVTTRVMAPPQNLAEGTLKLSVLSGRIRAIRLTADSTTQRARLWNALPVRAGDVLNLRDIEQGLENFERVPTAQANIQIEPADGPDAKPGESDLVIRWTQDRFFRVTASADDSGSKTTGKYQDSLTLSYDNWLTLNDLFYASIGHDLGGGDPGSRGTNSQTLHYALPFSYWLLAWNTSDSSYHQDIAGTNQTYSYSGNTSNSDIQLSRLFYRDAVHKATLSLGGWLRSSSNYVDDTEVQVQRRQMAGWQLGLSQRSAWPAVTLNANMAYRYGTGAMGSMPAPEEATGEGTSRPRLVTADLQLARPFKIGDTAWKYTAALRGQWNQTALVPQDRFAIGGRYTVRGFDGELTLAADRGWLIRNDVAVTLGHSTNELYVALDHGQVGGQSAQYLVGNKLTGTAIGLRGVVERVSYDVFWSWPLYMPQGFQTASSSGGFSLNWAY